MRRVSRPVLVGLALLAVVPLAAPQFKAILKVVGVGAAVKQFGPQINTALNKLSSHKDSVKVKTKVVPIISAGVASRQAIGAAQVMGPAVEVDKVQAVAQLDQDVLGKEVKIRAMIPVDSMNPTNISRVEGVGVSGIVDLKL